jgi:hypothetical protein
MRKVEGPGRSVAAIGAVDFRRHHDRRHEPG